MLTTQTGVLRFNPENTAARLQGKKQVAANTHYFSAKVDMSNFLNSSNSENRDCI
jgi:hypothetical protein